MRYKFLGQEYKRYWTKKIQEKWNDMAHSKNPEQAELLALASSKLGLTREEYIHKYLKPWFDLDILAMEQLARTLTLFSDEHFIAPVKVTVEYKQENKFKAVEWLTVHLLDLNLEGFREGFIEESAQEETKSVPIPLRIPHFHKANAQPFKQCFYCGRLDNDEKGAFNKKKKYCCLKKCASGSNPEMHEDGCCYKAAALSRKTLQQKLKRLEVKEAPKSDMVRLFALFTRERLNYIEKNIKNDIRTERAYLAQASENFCEAE